MSATVHRLHPVSEVGHFLRLGHTGHRKLEDLHASGRFAVDRVVVDAAHDLRRVLEELQVTIHNLSRSRAPTNRAGRSSAEATTTRGG